jgi:hypothetical protein
VYHMELIDNFKTQQLPVSPERQPDQSPLQPSLCLPLQTCIDTPKWLVKSLLHNFEK